ncbi:transposase, MuDR, MULE transposase domain protein [Tanacetum coccineum]
MNAKFAGYMNNTNHRSGNHIGGSSSQTHEIGDVYLTAEELHQLHLDEEALRETLEEQIMDEKARGEKIRQKQANDDEYFMEFRVMRIDSDYDLDIDDSDLHLTHVLRSSSSAHVEPSSYTLNSVTIIPGPAGVVQLSNSICVEPSSSTPNPVRIIPGPAGVVQLSNSICVEPSSSTPNPVRIIPSPAGLVQQAKQLKENVFILDPDGALMSTQEYMQKVVEDVGEDADFNSGAWVSATNYVNAFGGTVTGCLGDIDNFLKKGKLEQVVAIVKSCSPNALGDLNVTLKDLSGTVPGTIHYKVLDVGSYEKDITVGAAMILANVSVFTPKPSKHYLNITKRNVVEVFRKDTVSLA